MVGEAVWILEDATADHKAIDFRILSMKFQSVGFIFDVAVDDEFGFGTNLVAKSNNVRDEFIVGGDFAHFFFGAKMDGESGGVLGEQSRKPVGIFFWLGPAETGFNRNREVSVFFGIFKAFYGELRRFNHCSATAGAIDIFIRAAEI